MADIIDVAKYILEKCGTMTTMKLQKLCYYSQAWHLIWEEVSLFKEDFQAWANGPVCYELFSKHRGHFLISVDDLPQLCGNNLTATECEIIDMVIEFYGDKEGHWLSELTHKERPWREARQKANALPGDACNEIITKESIADYLFRNIIMTKRRSIKIENEVTASFEKNKNNWKIQIATLTNTRHGTFLNVILLMKNGQSIKLTL